jgi:ring-1,2-phenylacetyl-CoA epoxidase subunit PaaC
VGELTDGCDANGRNEGNEMTEPVTVGFETTEGLSDACARGLRHLLLALVDTKLLLGYHYGEWTFGTPELEAAVANCSLAQAELGHVRLLCAVLSKHFDDDPDVLVERRPAAEFANVRFLDRPIRDWAGVVAANYVVDLAATRTLHALRDSAFAPLRMSVEKMLDEERFHLHHGRGWFRTLARRGDGDAEALAGHTVAALSAVLEWCGPSDDPEDRALVDAGIKADDNATVYRAVADEVLSLAAECGLSIPEPAPADLAGWTADNRRIGSGGPDEEILYHLRGSMNEIFKL